MSKVCIENSCVLIAGETAEMPGFYGENEYDLSGTIVGVAEESDLMSKRSCNKGDVLIGIHSSGLHTNGYSCTKSLLKTFQYHYIDELRGTIGETFLSVHKSYLNSVYPLISNKNLHSISHITGGGILENTSRVLSKELSINIDWNSWDTLYI